MDIDPLQGVLRVVNWPSDLEKAKLEAMGVVFEAEVNDVIYRGHRLRVKVTVPEGYAVGMLHSWLVIYNLKNAREWASLSSGFMLM